jgi:hypothetical protein
MVTEMTPSQVHMHLDVSFNTGKTPRVTVGEPGTQGVAVAGMHGIGVRTPRAAAVAEATVGLAIDEHMPNGMMFFIGTWSMIVATGMALDVVLFSGVTTNVDGANPKVHCSMAPFTTCLAIASLSSQEA